MMLQILPVLVFSAYVTALPCGKKVENEPGSTLWDDKGFPVEKEVKNQPPYA